MEWSEEKQIEILGAERGEKQLEFREEMQRVATESEREG